jgi:hypothetical protein
LVEETELEFHGQDPANGLVDAGTRDLARPHVLQDRVLPLIGSEDLHAHVDASVDRVGDRASQVRSGVVSALQRRNVLVVADDDALETHLLAQDIGQ